MSGTASGYQHGGSTLHTCGGAAAMRVEPWRRTLNQQDSAVYGRYHCQPLPRPSDPRCCHHATPPPGDHVRQGASILCKHGHGAGRETRCNPDSHRASCPATGLRLGGHTYTTFSHQLITTTLHTQPAQSTGRQPTCRPHGLMCFQLFQQPMTLSRLSALRLGRGMLHVYL